MSGIVLGAGLIVLAAAGGIVMLWDTRRKRGH
jgi:hypothetical protein